MAFVNPLTTTFLGSRAQPSLTQSRRPMHNTAPSNAPVRMAFSSIDTPGSATVLRDFGNISKEDCITAAYKHVFGNAYLMDSERAELARVESDFKHGAVIVSELVRAMGKSEAYRKRFFERSGAYRFIELNCKHFLGRGPLGQEEISFHVQKLMNEGYEAEIDSYIDSQEYANTFGPDCVPRFVYKGEYPRNDDFNKMNIMRKFWDGCSTSTVSGSTAPGKAIPAQLTMGHGGYVNGFVGVSKGLPAGFRPEPTGPQKTPSLAPVNAQAPLRVRIKIAENLYQVYEVPAQKMPDEPAWKKELAGEKKWNGVWF